MSDNDAPPTPKVVTSPAIPVVDIPHAGWSEDGRQITLSFRLLSDDLATFIMPAASAEKVIRATQHALAGSAPMRVGQPAVGGSAYDAETIAYEVSPDGKKAILVFEGVDGPSRRIRLEANAVSLLRRDLKRIEDHLRRRRMARPR